MSGTFCRETERASLPPGIAAVAIGPCPEIGTDRLQLTRCRSGGDSSRTDEAESLRKCRSLIGLTRDQVRSMLGAEKFTSNDHDRAPRALYIPVPGIDCTYLAVTFGRDGKAKRAEIETH